MTGRSLQCSCRYLAAPLLLSAFLAACAAPPPVAPISEPPEPAQPPIIETPPEKIPTPPPLPDPDRLLGLEPRRIQDILGTPSLVRREDAAQVMQFKDGNCVLDVIFYEEAAGGAFLSRHLASRLTNGTRYEPQDCLVAILPGGQFPVGIFPEEDSPEEPAQDQGEPEVVPPA